MRISDWSSDVCSSDLRGLRHRLGIAQRAGGGVGAHLVVEPADQLVARQLGNLAGEIPQRQVERPAAAVMELDVGKDPVVTLDGERIRSEEHTSELQARMRISYADLCFKKKKEVHRK